MVEQHQSRLHFRMCIRKMKIRKISAKNMENCCFQQFSIAFYKTIVSGKLRHV